MEAQAGGVGIDRSTATTLPSLTAEVAVIAKTLAETRPTAVNLFWGIGQVRDLYNELAAKNTPIPQIKESVVALALLPPGCDRGDRPVNPQRPDHRVHRRPALRSEQDHPHEA